MEGSENLIGYLKELCLDKLSSLGIKDDERYLSRLDYELSEIEAQDAITYVCENYINCQENNLKFKENENNSLVFYLLEMCSDFDINKEVEFVQGDMPDIDVDMMKDIRDYIKNEWATQKFGSNNTCSIGNYGTYKLKSAFLDMARVYDKDRNEILSVTKKLALRDEEGHDLSYDKAIELFPELKEYCENNPEVAEAAKRLAGRIKTMGKHAGGLIVSSVPLDTIVPLVSSETEDGKEIAVSSFTEGLSSTDLGPLGLVKYDILVVSDLERIYECVKLIKSRYNLPSVCALPGKGNWTDISYLNDPLCLKTASSGDLKGIFQFDGDGIRSLVKKSGVDSFEDLVALTSLYRPGPMGLLMHETYIKRKRGMEKYELHPKLQSILGKTYGVLVYQEQVLRILNEVGGIPLSLVEKIRKAISKKKEKEFISHKKRFLQNAKSVLSWTDEQVKFLWDQIAEFAEYGFNKSHACAYTYISSRLLWLKCYYPLEFYTISLRMAKDDVEFKKIKNDALQHGIEINKIDINKSKETFDIIDNKIYTGFSNIKGMGLDIAKEIVKHQPYSSLEDFLDKFGTHANTLKALISLRAFGEEYEPYKAYCYCQYFKEYKSSIKSKQTRLEKNKTKAKERLIKFLPEDICDSILVKDNLEEIFPEECEMKKKIMSCLRFVSNCLDDMEESVVSYNDFVIPPDVDIKEDMVAVLKGDVFAAEIKFYGFRWNHEIESSPDYKGEMTFSGFRDENEDSIMPVECMIIKSPQERKTKTGKTLYSFIAEDSNGEQKFISIWPNDYERFKDELNKEYNYVRIRVTQNNGWFSFESLPRFKKAPAKELDARLVEMRKE